MGLFSKRKPASQGLLGVAIGTQKTVTLELGYNSDSAAICAFFAAYVCAHADTFGATGPVMPLFVVLCSRSLAEDFPQASNHVESYGDAFVTAKRTLEAFGLQGGWESFHRIWGATHAWLRSDDILIPHVVAMNQVVDAMLQQESRKWKPDAT